MFLLRAQAAEREQSPAWSFTGRDPPCPQWEFGSGWEGEPAQEMQGETQARGLEARLKRKATVLIIVLSPWVV